MNNRTGNTGAENNVTVELLSEMHRNVTMGSETLTMVVPKISGGAMMTSVTDQMEHYGKFTTKTEELLGRMNVKPRGSSLMKRTMTKMGIAMNTAVDSSDQHIAAMIGKGTMTGLTELTGKLHKLTDADKEAVNLCRDILDYEKQEAMNILDFV